MAEDEGDWTADRANDREADDGEDFDENEILRSLGEERVQSREDMNAVIVVDNIPQVDVDKFSKLQAVLRKLFSKFGEIVNIEIPIGGTPGKTLGCAGTHIAPAAPRLGANQSGARLSFCFVEYETQDRARAAIGEMDNYKLDKAHQFRVNAFQDFERFANIPDKFEAKMEDYEQRDNTSGWCAARPPACTPLDAPAQSAPTRAVHAVQAAGWAQPVRGSARWRDRGVLERPALRQ
jgi:hypothetical protein